MRRPEESCLIEESLNLDLQCRRRSRGLVSGCHDYVSTLYSVPDEDGVLPLLACSRCVVCYPRKIFAGIPANASAMLGTSKLPTKLKEEGGKIRLDSDDLNRSSSDISSALRDPTRQDDFIATSLAWCHADTDKHGMLMLRFVPHSEIAAHLWQPYNYPQAMDDIQVPILPTPSHH